MLLTAAAYWSCRRGCVCDAVTFQLPSLCTHVFDDLWEIIVCWQSALLYTPWKTNSNRQYAEMQSMMDMFQFVPVSLLIVYVKLELYMYEHHRVEAQFLWRHMMTSTRWWQGSQMYRFTFLPDNPRAYGIRITVVMLRKSLILFALQINQWRSHHPLHQITPSLLPPEAARHDTMVWSHQTYCAAAALAAAAAVACIESEWCRRCRRP